MFLPFSNIHWEVNIINLSWTEFELRKILISFFLYFPRTTHGHMGAARCHQINTLVILSCIKIYIRAKISLFCHVCNSTRRLKIAKHDDVIKWKHFPRYWPFVRGIHRSPVNSPHKGQWRGALMFSLICAWINDKVNSREAGDLRRYRAHYDVIVMEYNTSNICSRNQRP